jgi:hypothetical protein
MTLAAARRSFLPEAARDAAGAAVQDWARRHGVLPAPRRPD